MSAMLGGLGAAWGGLCPVCMAWQADLICRACLACHGGQTRRCLRCALTLGPAAAQDDADIGRQRPAASGWHQMSCGDCLRQPPPQRAAVAAFDYVYPWAGLLGRLKFHDALDLARPLAGALAQAITT
jgi:predicted amidophosphoribosyltransferase